RAAGRAPGESSRDHVRGCGGAAAQAARPRRRGARQGLPGHAHGARGGRARGALRRSGWLVFYELLVPLAKYNTAFNVFRYITFRTAMATVTALVISLILGPWLINRLREMQHGGSSVREDTPERHQKTKAGTPTMGGIGILVAILASTLLWANLRNRYVWVLVLVTAGFGLTFLKGWLLPFGWIWIPFAILVIVGSSNAVTLPDELAGIAIGRLVTAG